MCGCVWKGMVENKKWFSPEEIVRGRTADEFYLSVSLWNFWIKIVSIIMLAVAKCKETNTCLFKL